MKINRIAFNDKIPHAITIVVNSNDLNKLSNEIAALGSAQGSIMDNNVHRIQLNEQALGSYLTTFKYSTNIIMIMTHEMCHAYVSNVLNIETYCNGILNIPKQEWASIMLSADFSFCPDQDSLHGKPFIDILLASSAKLGLDPDLVYGYSFTKRKSLKYLYTCLKPNENCIIDNTLTVQAAPTKILTTSAEHLTDLEGIINSNIDIIITKYKQKFGLNFYYKQSKTSIFIKLVNEQTQFCYILKCNRYELILFKVYNKNKQQLLRKPYIVNNAYSIEKLKSSVSSALNTIENDINEQL